MATVVRDSQLVAEIICGGTGRVRQSQLVVEIIHTGSSEVPVFTSDGGTWKLFRFDLKVRREETA